MPVITIGSTKGGVGKSTLTIAMASELAVRGFKVHVLDADKRLDTQRWIKDADIPGLTADPGTYINVGQEKGERVTEENLIDLIDQAKPNHDFIFIDPMGGVGSVVLTYAIMESDLIIVPTCLSEMDVNAVDETVRIIRSAEKAKKQPIAFKVLLNKVPTLPTKVHKYAAERLGEKKLPMMIEMVWNRTHFEQMSYSGRPLRAHVDLEDEKSRRPYEQFSALLTHIGIALDTEMRTPDLPAPRRPDYGDLDTQEADAAAQAPAQERSERAQKLEKTAQS
jgi:chromosome partitioning protein